MSIHNLHHLLDPQSVALIGASNRAGSIGQVVMRNLLTAGFRGDVYPVNPRHQEVQGIRAYSHIADLPVAPDLAIICTPAERVPGIIKEAGLAGTRAAIVLSAGLREGRDEGESLTTRMLEAGRPYGMRILGPNCLGLLVPGIGLNASFAHIGSEPGRLAMVSQSGALCTTILDWAHSRGIGFSHFISVGDMADVDFGDLLNYLSAQRGTDAILLYIEHIREARKFLSAARATARHKPIVVIKSGRVEAGARAAASHTGALAGRDDVFDAAIRRAGMLRVTGIDDLFNAVETLSRARRVHGDRLLIVTNGGGPGVLATDALITAGGRLCELSAKTVEALDQCLPPTWSRANPVDIIGDASPERYEAALQAALVSEDYDAVLVMLVPTATVDNAAVARMICNLAADVRRPVLTCWMGAGAVAEARSLFAAAQIPSFETPRDAVQGFMQMVDYHRNQATLRETPRAIAEAFEPDRNWAKDIVSKALDEGREWLTEPEAKAVLEAYCIPVVSTRIARDGAQAEQLAEELGYPIAVKVISHEVTHKSDVGGVVLDVQNAQRLREVITEMSARVAMQVPGARIVGYSVQRMERRPGALELLLGASTDPIFGPVIAFGQGGTAVELWRDVAVALPPLNMALAADVISRTRISRILEGHRGLPGVAVDALQMSLIKLSQLVIDRPEIVEVDINPLLADAQGVVALDARMRVQPAALPSYQRLAIHPYPDELEERSTLDTGERVLMRPIRPEDESAHATFLQSIDPADLRFRFFHSINRFTHEQLAAFTQIDYAREMAFIATRKGSDGKPETLGVVRASVDANNECAEFAVLVRSDMKRRGLARALMRKIIDYHRDRGTGELVGIVMPENDAMLSMARAFGFDSAYSQEDGTRIVKLALR